MGIAAYPNRVYRSFQKQGKPVRLNGKMSLRYQNGTWDWGTKWPWDTSVHQVRLLNMQQWTQNCVELMEPDNETLLSQTIYFGWYDGTKHPINCLSIPDQAGITKRSTRCFCSKMSKTRFQVFYSKMSKTASQIWEANLIACVSCQQKWGRKTRPHAITNYTLIIFMEKMWIGKGVSKMFHRFAGEKGNKKAPTTRIKGWSFFDLLLLCTIQARL